MIETTEFSADLSAATFALLRHPRLPISEWKQRVLQLEKRYGLDVYSSLLFLLTHQPFEAEDAKRHWEQVLDVWEALSRAVTWEIDLRVAVLHYFLEVQKTLENPTIVEIRILRKVQDSVVLDELTQLYNYRYFRDRIDQEVKRAVRYNSSVSLLMVDADDFKLFNDRNGHDRGNIALQQLAQVLKEAVREVDVITRYGGEEFAVILPATLKRGALVAGEKIRLKMEETRIQGESNLPSKNLTVSIGAACVPTDANTMTDLIRQADSALYKAKRMGKNRVEACSEERRSFRRSDAALLGRLQLPDDKTLPFTTSNVSPGGLLINTRESLDEGSVVRVELDFAPNERTITFTGSVAWASGQEPHCHAGIKLLHVEPAELYHFKEYLANAGPDTDE